MAPKTHLASKTEILAHFEDITAKAVAESGVQLVTLFGYQHAEHHVTQWPDEINHVQVLHSESGLSLGGTAYGSVLSLRSNTAV